MANILANYVKFLRGTPTAYNNLAQKNSDTLYFVAEKDATVGKLFLGEILISGSTNAEGVVDYLSELKDVDTAGAVQNSVLGFDVTSNKWKVMDISSALTISVMGGATAQKVGTQGLVPAPAAGQQGHFLRGDGTWAPIEIPEATPKTQIFEVELNVIVDEEGNKTKEEHMTAIAQVVGEAVLTIGDIAIVKDSIVENNFQYTAYVYNGTTWAAMDGNYNANNVYFDEDFVFTKAIGTVTIPSSGSKTIDAKGKSVKQFFAGLFAAEAESDITKPSISAFSINKAGNYEAGTSLTDISYTATFEDGKYTYGPEPTGSIVTGWTIKDNAGNSIGTTATGALNDYIVPGDSSFYLKATATYSDGDYAKTNLGNISTKTHITAGTTSNKDSNAINGYWKYFYGVLDVSIKNDVATNVTSTFIRENLTHGGAYAASILNLNAHEGAKCLIVACPANKIGITEAIMPSALQSPIPWVDGSPFTVSVEGATNAVSTNYNVWIYEPASIDASETYKITLG